MFDFDGTLTTQDTFIQFLAWHRPKISFLTDVVITLPLLGLYALGIVGNDVHKMTLFSRRFAGMRYEDFRAEAAGFARERIPRMLRAEALARLREHQRLGHQTVIISASFHEWIEPWAKAQGVDLVLASRPQVMDGILTGRLDGANCHGDEKVQRLFAAFPNRASYVLYAYGDSKGDRAMLRCADRAFYRRFA